MTQLLWSTPSPYSLFYCLTSVSEPSLECIKWWLHSYRYLVQYLSSNPRPLQTSKWFSLSWGGGRSTRKLSLFRTVATTSSSDHQYVLGTIVSLAVACIGAANNLTIWFLGVGRKENQKVHPYILLLTSGLVGLILAIIIGPMDQQNQIFHNFAQVNFQMLIGSSLLGIFGLFLNTYSCQNLNPVVFSVLRCQEVVIAFGVQYFSSDMVTPTLNSVVGTGMVVFSSLLVPMEDVFMSGFGSGNKLKV